MTYFSENAAFQHLRYQQLFDAMNQGFCVIEMIWNSAGNPINYTFIEINRAFENQTGIKDAVGQTIRDIWPDLEQHWLDIFGEIARTGIQRQFELPLAHLDSYFEVDAFKIEDDHRDLLGVFFNNITARNDAQQVTRFDNLKNRFVIELNDALKGKDASAVQKKAAEILGKTLHADRVVYKVVTAHDNQRAFKVDEFFNTDKAPFQAGVYPFHLFGKLIGEQENGKPIHIDHVEASDLRANEKALFESIKVRSFIQVPLIRNGKYVAALAVHQTTPRIWSNYEIELVEETAQRTWGALEYAKAEDSLKLFNNNLEELVTQRTAEVGQARTNLQENKDLLQSIFNATPHAMSVFKPIYNAEQQVEDFELLLYNLQVSEIINVGNKVVTYSEFFPISIKYGVLERFKKVMRTGNAEDFEVYFQEENLWFHFKASTVNQLLIVMRENITERKIMEATILENQSLLQSVFHTSLIGMSLLEAVYDQHGKIIDFTIKITNQALDKEVGRNDLIGKRYVQEFPGVKKAGLFDMMVKVMQTGIADGKEYHYPYDGFDKWYSCMFIKTEGSLVATNLDITEQKEAELGVMQNTAMIKAIAQSAPNMLYAIDIKSLQQIYSNAKIEKMVNLSQQQISNLGKHFFSKYIHPDDLHNFFNSIKEIADANDEKPRTLIYRLIDAEGRLHWIKTTRTIYQRNDRGEATHLVGVSQDITHELSLGERNRELEIQTEHLRKKQQQAVLEAALMAQEEERRRISDNLHNGMGQVLFGAKARLDHLNVSSEDDWDNLNQVKELLNSTIAESRKLSHQLMPPMLEDYGLTYCLLDICKTLSNQTRLIFNPSGLRENLDNYIQMVIYRIVQELMINIVNHAEASIAQVTVRQDGNVIRINVEDNGVGFDKVDSDSWGLGLKSIATKINMLNGSLSIMSTPELETGTKIEIKFSLP